MRLISPEVEISKAICKHNLNLCVNISVTAYNLKKSENIRLSQGFLDAALPTSRCKALVCNDGKVHDGFFCGKGRCNPAGCQCVGGCHEGDAVANFRLISGFHGASKNPYNLNPTTWG